MFYEIHVGKPYPTHLACIHFERIPVLYVQGTWIPQAKFVFALEALVIEEEINVFTGYPNVSSVLYHLCVSEKNENTGWRPQKEVDGLSLQDIASSGCSELPGLPFKHICTWNHCSVSGRDWMLKREIVREENATMTKGGGWERQTWERIGARRQPKQGWKGWRTALKQELQGVTQPSH